MHIPKILLLLVSLCFLAGCSLEEDAGPLNGPFPELTRTTCDELGPIVFVPGALTAGDIWSLQFQRLLSNNTCKQDFYVFDWNSVVAQTRPDQRQLEEFIDQVLFDTRTDRVQLVAHSNAGGMAYDFLSRPSRAAKVKAYAHIGSYEFDTLPGPPDNKIPTVNIWSPDNRFIRRKGEIPGAKNVYLLGKDHYQTATSKETFRALYEFFTEGLIPLKDKPDLTTEPTLSGKAIGIGGNNPEVNALIEIYELEPGTGRRRSDEPAASLVTDADGKWGPVQLRSETYYEFFFQPNFPDARSVHFYREPFQSDNPLVYLRTPPPTTHPFQLFFSFLPKDDNQSVLGVFSASQIVVDYRDNLLAGGFELSTAQLAGEAENASGFLLYDDGDLASSGSSHELYENTPFLSGADLFFPASGGSFTKVQFNGRNLYVPNWRSATDGLVFVVFD